MLSKIFDNFFSSEKSSGFILISCTILSLGLANSVIGNAYQNIWHTHVLSQPLDFWINEVLMSVFFLLIGLEIEREMYCGELSDLKSALLPISAAIGGMCVPALIHFIFNRGSIYQSGVAIPTATDIAFSLGILALLGSRVPNNLKIFLTALAIVDDLGAILIIGLFYTKSFSFVFLGVAILFIGLLVLMNFLKVKWLTLYLTVGVGLWYCFLKSGIHPTIAGVILAFAIPFDGKNENSISHRLETHLAQPVAFFILPLFALANTDIVLPIHWFNLLGSTNSLGIIMGLTVGKPLGIICFTLLSVMLGLCNLPEGMNLKQLIGVGMLAGIGFTMSVFITLLAFSNDALILQSKIAIMVASVLSGVLGFFFLKRQLPS